MAVLGLMTGEQTEEGCCCVTTARPPSPVASAQYGRTWPHVTRCHRAQRTQKTGFLSSGPGPPVASMSPSLFLV
ncbi:hypothetical protein CapIbe_011835 [Capra ibex]